MEQFSIEWQAPEFEHRPKSVSWYWSSIILAVIILAVSVWQRNFLFGVFVVIAEVLILVWSNREPRTVNFTLTEKGLAIGAKSYPVADFENFAIDTYDEVPTIVVKLHRRLLPFIHVGVPADRLENIKVRLTAMVPEVEYDPSLIDSLERFLGF